MKKVLMKAKPTPKVPAEAWVESRGSQNGGGDDMKRLTIDVPKGLHTRIKIACAQRGVKMADEIRGLLEKHFPTS